jgi:hypothetical protein
MGWLYQNTLDGHSSPKAYLDAQFTYSRTAQCARVLASAVVRGRVYYAAVELHRSGEEVQVIGIVCLINHDPLATDGMVFGYKDMDESVGPCESECPEASLDLLTPTDALYARAWRERCRANAVRRRPG